MKIVCLIAGIIGLILLLVGWAWLIKSNLDRKKLEREYGTLSDIEVHIQEAMESFKKITDAGNKAAEDFIELQEQITQLNQDIEQVQLNLDKTLEERTNVYEDLMSLSKLKETTIDTNNQQIQLEYDKQIRQAEQDLLKRKDDLREDYLDFELECADCRTSLMNRNTELLQEIEDKKSELNDLKAKQRAYLEERAHQEEMLAQKDYYRLVLDDQAIADIKLLRQVQLSLSKKEAIDKILWSLYYKPAYDILMTHIIKSKDKVCGIYKITSLVTERAYIGQSVDIATRASDHIKSGLSCAPSTNKLYQAMKKDGIENFLFEVLEEVPRDKLNEREVYWIDFYDTKNTGLNISKGGS